MQLTKEQNALLLKAVDLLHEADALMQQGWGKEEGEELYCIHNAIECAADDILDYIQQNNPEITAEVEQ
jgi:hypothetical protein